MEISQTEFDANVSVTISFLVQHLTFWADCGKAVWNRYFQLFLLHAGFSVTDVGIIKSSSLIAKACFQLLVPAMEDSGYFAKYLPSATSSHVIVVLAVLFSIPVLVCLEPVSTANNMQFVIILKSLLSFSNAFTGLVDGIVARTVQRVHLKYSKQQSLHAIAWCCALLVGGVLVDLYGYFVIFPLVVFSRMLVVCLVISLGRLCPLARKERTERPDVLKFLKRGMHEFSDPLLCKMLLFMSVWGSCFIVIETMTFIQMHREFKHATRFLGVSSVLSVVGGVPIYHFTPQLIRLMGHENLITLGIAAAVVFLLLHCLLTEVNSMLSLPLSVIRGISYAAIWAGCMDSVLFKVQDDMLTSAQALINFMWFTVGQGGGYVVWTHIYSKSGPQFTYGVCAILMTLTALFLRNRVPRRSHIMIYVLALIGIASTYLVYFHQNLPQFNHTGNGGIVRITSTKIRDTRAPFLDSGVEMLFVSSSQISSPLNVSHKHRLRAIKHFPVADVHRVVGRGLSSNFTTDTRNPRAQQSPGTDDHLARNTLTLLKSVQLKTTMTHNTIPNTLGEYVRYRMKHTDPLLYSHFADRRWVNQWGKVRRCNASVPKLLAFFDTSNISVLADFIAPISGAVVKVNHMAGYVSILKPNTSLDSGKLHLYHRHIHNNYENAAERHYAVIPHGIIIEEFLSVFADKTAVPIDYKIYAFNGKLALVRAVMNRACTFKPRNDCSGYSAYFDPVSFRRLPYKNNNLPDFTGHIAKPCGWEDTMLAAQCLSSGINFARIDMYIVDCQPYFSEMTMTPTGGSDESTQTAVFLAGFLKSWDIYPDGLEPALLG